MIRIRGCCNTGRKVVPSGRSPEARGGRRRSLVNSRWSRRSIGAWWPAGATGIGIRFVLGQVRGCSGSFESTSGCLALTSFELRQSLKEVPSLVSFLVDLMVSLGWCGHYPRVVWALPWGLCWHHPRVVWALWGWCGHYPASASTTLFRCFRLADCIPIDHFVSCLHDF